MVDKEDKNDPISVLRKSMRLTRKDLGVLLGMSEAAICRWEEKIDQRPPLAIEKEYFKKLYTLAELHQNLTKDRIEVFDYIVAFIVRGLTKNNKYFSNLDGRFDDTELSNLLLQSLYIEMSNPKTKEYDKSLFMKIEEIDIWKGLKISGQDEENIYRDFKSENPFSENSSAPNLKVLKLNIINFFDNFFQESEIRVPEKTLNIMREEGYRALTNDDGYITISLDKFPCLLIMMGYDSELDKNGNISDENEECIKEAMYYIKLLISCISGPDDILSMYRIMRKNMIFNKQKNKG